MTSTISKSVFGPFILGIPNYSYLYKLCSKLIAKVTAFKFASDLLYIRYYSHFGYYPLLIPLDPEFWLISGKAFSFSLFLVASFIPHIST